jgi:hypothetical protein
MPEMIVIPREFYYHELEYVRGLENVLKALLLFHRGGPWTATDAAEWLRLTESPEATAKALCDRARKVLGHD